MIGNGDGKLHPLSLSGETRGTGFSGPGLPLSGGVIAVIVAGSFLLWRPEAFRPSRPSVADPAAVLAVEGQNVRARLWEDPFAAVARHLKAIADDVSDPRAAGDADRDERRSDPGFGDFDGDVVALGVMVPGGPYDEQAERRLRSRYSTLAALGVLGYEPEDSAHLGYFEPKKLPGLVVPYEWFRPRVDGERLLLLWLDDGAFHPTPLARLALLAEELQAAAGDVDLVILGPFGSTNLLAMAREMDGAGGEALAGVRIFSPSATIADDLLPGDGRSLDERFREWTGDPRSRFLRTTGTDEDLAMTLVDELRRRGVCVAEDTCDERKRAHVALVSEWDTHYGRALPCAFMSAVLGGDYPSTCLASSSVAEPGWIHRFSYMRGLDGQLPTTKKDEPKAADAKGKTTEAAPVERPTGRRRLDYLRRLAGQLQRRDADLRQSSDGRGLQAIGILGSDEYDKLLVLQALRQRFPRVLFFTTDLHAGLLHPSEYDAARNLIVAANFGLELDARLQGSVPSFRDGYQTARFFSLLLAFDSHFRETPPDQSFVDARLRPRIFEIGRSGAFDLSVDPPPPLEEPERWAVSRNIHPPRGDLLARVPEATPIHGLLLAVALAFALLYRLTYRHMQPDEERAPAQMARARSLLGLFLVAGFAVLSHLIVTQGQAGEPFTLVEGISIWPSLYLRLLVGALSLYFFLVGWITIRDSDEKTMARFLVERQPIERRRLRTLRLDFGRTLRRSWRWLADPSVHFWASGWARWPRRRQPATTPAALTADQLLQAYDRRSRLSRRLCRVIPLWLCYFACGFLFIEIFGKPNVPFRGEISETASLVLTVGVAVSLLTFLILWVADATRLSVWLARQIVSPRTKWPEKTKLHYSRKLNLGRDLLEEWLDVQLIACHSVAVGRLVYYPAIVMILMVASRAPYFDNWDFPLALFLVISLSLAYLLCCAVALRRSAEAARSAAIDRYQVDLFHAMGMRDRSGRADQLRLLLERTHNLSVGAFVPISQQPWVRAVALLLSGSGSLVLLDYLVWLD